MKKTKKYCIYQLDIRGIPFKYHIYSNLNDLKVDLYKLINTQKELYHVRIRQESQIIQISNCNIFIL